MSMIKTLFTIVLGVGFFGGDVAKAANNEANPNGRSLTLKGRYLVASTDVHDPKYRQSVIYLVHHDAFGAMGVVINRLMAKGPVDSLLEAFGIDGDPGDQQVKMHYGGPVEPESSLVLHRDDYQSDTTAPIGNRLAVSSSDDVLVDLAAGEGPTDSLFILGYAGWGSEQLENQITSGVWHVVDADDTMLFDDDIATKWRRALALRGFEL